MHTPTFPVTIGVAFGRVAGALLVSHQDVRGPSRNRRAGRSAGRIAPPGIPNTTSAPTRSSDLTRDCAPVSSSALSFSDISGLLPC